MKTVYLLCPVLSLWSLLSSQTQTVPANLDVREISSTKWDSAEGVAYKQVVGANLGATSFEIIDGDRIAFLSNSSGEIIVIDRTSGRVMNRFEVAFAPRDFSYGEGHFFVLTENQVTKYDGTGREIDRFSFPSSYRGVERLARFNNSTYLLLPSGNSAMIESNGYAVEPIEKEGWITGAGHFVATRLAGNNSYYVKVTMSDQKTYEREFSTDSKVAGVYVVGSTNRRIALDVQTFVSENPISVRRSILMVELSNSGLGPIVASTKVPDCYYVLSNKDFSLTADGVLFNMITAPQGLFIFTLSETTSGNVQDYPSSISRIKYHFGDHLIRVDEK